MSDQDTFVEPKLSPLFTEEQIAARIAELGGADCRRLSAPTSDAGDGSKGSFVFAADLSRAIQRAQVAQGLPGSTVTCEFLGLRATATKP